MREMGGAEKSFPLCRFFHRKIWKRKGEWNEKESQDYEPVLCAGDYPVYSICNISFDERCLFIIYKLERIFADIQNGRDK